ncbi:response regulator transcription factor [Paraburkholderia sp. JPY303]|uniref:response regulator transcription factor n=1 Tax=Paraburkholderia atlantica TaxID=2654982 RepID=UPI0015914F3C|nr:response regulator transcription factor [Paraburkholderia atlantica]NUY33898.1 response regulator transcription factor [Paraburkholderia atlantica]
MAAFQVNDTPASEANHAGAARAPDFRPAARRPEIGKVELAGRMCRILLVDGIAPYDADDGNEQSTHTIYALGQIVCFEFGGHRYVLVSDDRIDESSRQQSATNVNGGIEVGRLLSSREMEVVQLVCMGFLTKQIADRLHISEFTVRSYLKSIYAKLGVRSRAALVYRFMQSFRPSV